MLVEFSVTNYRSIGEKQTLCLIPAPKQKEFPENIFSDNQFSALNAIAIYGANASGKSNLIMCLSLMDAIVHLSARSSSTSKLPYDPFKLKEDFNEQPTELEIVFIADHKRYRYGFAYTQTTIIKEWLYRKNLSREVPLFIREDDVIDVRSSFLGSKKLIDIAIEATRSNALFLSQCDALNIEEAKSIIAWFDSLYVINGLNTEKFERTTVDLWQQEDYREKIIQYLNAISIDIQGIDISIKDIDEKSIPDNLPKSIREQLIGGHQYNVQSIHRTYSSNSTPTEKKIQWDFDNYESEGSKKALQLTGPILKAILNGEILVIDEIDAKLHPIMTLSIIDIFLDPMCNPKHAQLVFATHDTNLLSYSKLRRDQICFAEKNQWESTELFSLSDFVYFNDRNGNLTEERERKETNKEKRYMEGRYGAIPMLGNFKKQILKMLWQEREN